MFPIPQNEKLLETKVCKHCQASFLITDKDLELLAKVSPSFNGVKYYIPAPSHCPACRHVRRLAFRNERSLYRGTSDLSGKEFLSMYRPESGYTVYEQSEWWWDSWNPLDYGRDFDFSRSFFEQFAELMCVVPRPNMLTTWLDNSTYTNYSSYLNNCYLVFDSTECDNTYYTYIWRGCSHSLDMVLPHNCEQCYEIVDSYRLTNTLYATRCEDCSDCLYVLDCKNCKDCIGSVGLEHKQYYVFNEFVGQERYLQIRNEFPRNIDEIRRWFEKQQTWYASPARIISCEDCVGNHLLFSRNAIFCFDSAKLEDCRYVRNGENGANSMDSESFAGPISFSYEVNGAMDCYRVLFSMWAWWTDVYYSDLSVWKYLFGCVGAHSNQNCCILNKQYTKKEYDALVPRIIEHMKKTGEWGEFFPVQISPYGYNETIASDYYPLSKEQSQKMWYNWSDYEAPFPKVEKIIPASKLPDDITKIPDDILNWAIECEVTGKPFRIIKQELEFYRKHNLPIPRRHPDQRLKDRLKIKNLSADF